MASKAAEVTQESRPSQQEILERWLAERFRALGFPKSMSEDLVAAKVDWREAERLLKLNPPGGASWVYWYCLP